MDAVTKVLTELGRRDIRIEEMLPQNTLKLESGNKVFKKLKIIEEQKQTIQGLQAKIQARDRRLEPTVNQCKIGWQLRKWCKLNALDYPEYHESDAAISLWVMRFKLGADVQFEEMQQPRSQLALLMISTLKKRVSPFWNPKPQVMITPYELSFEIGAKPSGMKAAGTELHGVTSKTVLSTLLATSTGQVISMGRECQSWKVNEKLLEIGIRSMICAEWGPPKFEVEHQSHNQHGQEER